MKEIKLNKGYVTIVDDEDYDWLTAKYCWKVRIEPHGCYVYGSENNGRKRGRAKGVKNGEGGGTSKRRYVQMHRIIMGEPEGYLVDHKNGNGLDNRKENLRKATKEQSSYNRRGFGKGSKYKGVTVRKRVNLDGSVTVRYFAQIYWEGKQRSLGLHLTEKDAALAYNKTALQYHGEFARLNDVD